MTVPSLCDAFHILGNIWRRKWEADFVGGCFFLFVKEPWIEGNSDNYDSSGFTVFVQDFCKSSRMSGNSP